MNVWDDQPTLQLEQNLSRRMWKDWQTKTIAVYGILGAPMLWGAQEQPSVCHHLLPACINRPMNTHATMACICSPASMQNWLIMDNLRFVAGLARLPKWYTLTLPTQTTLLCFQGCSPASMQRIDDTSCSNYIVDTCFAARELVSTVLWMGCARLLIRIILNRYSYVYSIYNKALTVIFRCNA